jgi:hypothetical protein
MKIDFQERPRGPRRKYVGKCIYCGSQHNLTTEHALPESLGEFTKALDSREHDEFLILPINHAILHHKHDLLHRFDVFQWIA